MKGCGMVELDGGRSGKRPYIMLSYYNGRGIGFPSLPGCIIKTRILFCLAGSRSLLLLLLLCGSRHLVPCIYEDDPGRGNKSAKIKSGFVMKNEKSERQEQPSTSRIWEEAEF